MIRSLTIFAAFAVFSAAPPTYADEEQLAFDSMGSLMLEHEAEENRETSTSNSAPRHAHEGQCEEGEALLSAQLEGLRLELLDGVAYSARTLENISVAALDLAAFDLAAVKAKQAADNIVVLKGHELEAVRRALEEHRDEIDRHRAVLGSAADQKLMSSVQEALGKVQEALVAN